MVRLTHRQGLAPLAQALYRALKRSPCACGYHMAVCADGTRVRVSKTCQRCLAIEDYEGSEFHHAPLEGVTP
jgi:hypothetical protein